MKLPRLSNGMILACKYPQHGTRNILCNRLGQVIRHGRSNKGRFVTIRSADGTYRTLSLDRMIDAKIVTS
jgi:hypothetical protein